MIREFARLLDRLVTTTQRNGKVRLLADYFRTAPDPDRGFALAAFTDGLPVSFPMRRVLADLLVTRTDPVLYQMSRDYVGDTAETVALIWRRPEAAADFSPDTDVSLSAIVTAVSRSSTRELPRLIEGWLDHFDATERWALLKFLGGALRVGVSARLARTALAEAMAADLGEIEELWHALEPPYGALFAWLEGRGPKPDAAGKAVFRPVMLAQPLEDGELETLDPADLIAEWKWDGIRVQITCGGAGGPVKIFSRAGDDVSASFPDITESFAAAQGVVDGELLVMRDGAVQPFNDLQQRLNRKTVTQKMLAEFPAHVRLYDILFDGDEDVRALPLRERRLRLEAWMVRTSPTRADLSAAIPVGDLTSLQQLWAQTRESGIEGLMLKRAESPYLAGRPKGHWWKWKRAPLTADCVLMYAQRGSGKRSSLYSDFTFGCWRGEELVPVGKAYFGFTDAELKELDRWIRGHTVERFGPVRAVEPGLVLEVAYDAVARSARHKSGIAMRFPRIHRIRWDKPAAEADRLETLMGQISGM